MIISKYVSTETDKLEEEQWLHFLHFGGRGCVVESIYNVTCDIMAGGRMMERVAISSVALILLEVV